MEFKVLHAYAQALGVAVDVSSEAENNNYGAGIARLNGAVWHVRSARTTPTKPGAFVAFWRRNENGETAPFDRDEVGAGLLVFVEQAGKRGVFRFTAEHLDALGVVTGKAPGKRGFRVYPSWCEGLNATATRTQRAQAPGFYEF